MHLTTLSTPMRRWQYWRFLYWGKEGVGGRESNFRYIVVVVRICGFGWMSFVVLVEQKLCLWVTTAFVFPRGQPFCHFWVVFVGGVMLRVNLRTIGRVAYFLRGLVPDWWCVGVTHTLNLEGLIIKSYPPCKPRGDLIKLLSFKSHFFFSHHAPHDFIYTPAAMTVVEVSWLRKRRSRRKRK